MKRGELPVPAPAAQDEKAVELIRVWAAGGRQHISLASTAWSDPAAWGLMLVDLGRNIARAYTQRGAGEYDDVLARIKSGFDAEWSAPTDHH